MYGDIHLRVEKLITYSIVKYNDNQILLCCFFFRKKFYFNVKDLRLQQICKVFRKTNVRILPYISDQQSTMLNVPSIMPE